MAVRWGTVVIGFTLAALSDPVDRRAVIGGMVLVAYALVRTLRPLRYLRDRVASLVAVVLEVALNLGVVVGTGYWDSPYVFCLATAIVAAGFARGFGFATRTALTAILAVALPYHLDVAGARWFLTAQWGGELLLIAVVAGYARRLFGEAEQRTSLALEANELLHQLHRVAQTLPLSLDLDETLRSTLSQLRDLVPADVAAVLLVDPGPGWTVAAAVGARLTTNPADADLPAAARQAAGTGAPVLATFDAGAGLSPAAQA
ncbi:MAG: hypothetical protein ACRD0F_03615, partial [Acidimicrobiales bacterium]